ncbi:hypothetical protein [Azonexus sp.]|uniref:hypothetical protein n=1 Tax=Azonexus sp. TaxID=1872668 RepID=UPI0027BAE12E|nr:hypothetical protein [Azonexus sp.]
MKQRIDGDNNIQVGRVDGDLTIGQDDPFDPNNPNLTDCPSCWKPASRFAAQCPKCGYNIAGHFAALAREARCKELVGRAQVCGVLAVCGMLLINIPWLPESWKGTLSIAALVAGFVAMAHWSAAEKLR